ncbi:MAG: DUF4340 domain-containing protein [Verrucomicrobiota bacterium]
MNSKTTWTYLAIAAALFAFIFFVEHPLREKLNASRTTKIFPGFISASANRIEVRRAGEDIRVERTHDSWVLTKPLSYRAATAPIQTLLHELAELNWQAQITAAELKDRPNVQEEFGFASPAATLLTVQQSGLNFNLLIGTNTPVGEQVYVQVVGRAGVYVIDSEFLKLLPRSANEWRDQTLLRFSAPINTIKTRSGSKVFTLLHTNGSWRMTTPPARADNAKLEELLKKTAALQVAKFETDDPKADLESFGLQTPEMELVFAFDTNILATLLVGKSPTNEPSVVFAKIQNQNHIFRVAADALSDWRRSHTNFVDRHLVNLPPTGMTQIDVRGENTFSLQRDNSVWKMAGTNNFPVDSDLVREILVSLGKIEVNIEKDVVADFTAYGLAPPALEYTLKTAGALSNSVVALIHFGTNQPGKFFVRRLDEYSDTVSSIQPEQYHLLPQAPWQFRDRRIWSFASNEVMSVTVQQKGKERKLIRNAAGHWSFAPGSQGSINTFTLDEALYRLGDLKAVFWVSPDEKNPERFGFKGADHRIWLEVKRDGKIETLSLEFGDYSEFGTRYTATMSNGARMIFEFPWPLFFEVENILTIESK